MLQGQMSSNIRDMTLYVLINYRDPNKNPNTNKFAIPVVDIAATSRVGDLFG